MKNEYISVQLDKDDLLALITSREVNRCLPANLWYASNHGYDCWDMSALCRQDIKDLWSIYRVAKWGKTKLTGVV